MSLGSIAVNERLTQVLFVVVFVGATCLVGWQLVADSARLHPDRREVLVQEVDTGFIVQYRTRNNPYPVKEAVAHSGYDAAVLVKDYLKEPLPETQWGR
jgi:hypothetical protein